VMDLINAGKVQYTIDQQQRLQGYMPIIVLHVYNNGAGVFQVQIFHLVQASLIKAMRLRLPLWRA